MNHLTDITAVVNPFVAPTPEDAAWYTDHIHNRPATLVESVEIEAARYRSLKTPLGDFFAAQMERLAALVTITSAETLQEFEDRFDVIEEAARTNAYDHGFEDGRRTALGLDA